MSRFEPQNLASDEIIRVRLAYTKHQRHRVAHEVIAGPGYRLMSFVLWIKITVSLRVRQGEHLTVNSPLLVRMGGRGKAAKIVPMTGNFMARMDKQYASTLGWVKATIHSRRRGFATAAVRCGIHSAIPKASQCNTSPYPWLIRRLSQLV